MRFRHQCSFAYRVLCVSTSYGSASCSNLPYESHVTLRTVTYTGPSNLVRCAPVWCGAPGWLRSMTAPPPCFQFFLYAINSFVMHSLGTGRPPLPPYIFSVLVIYAIMVCLQTTYKFGMCCTSTGFFTMRNLTFIGAYCYDACSILMLARVLRTAFHASRFTCYDVLL